MLDLHAWLSGIFELKTEFTLMVVETLADNPTHHYQRPAEGRGELGCSPLPGTSSYSPMMSSSCLLAIARDVYKLSALHLHLKFSLPLNTLPNSYSEHIVQQNAFFVSTPCICRPSRRSTLLLPTGKWISKSQFHRDGTGLQACRWDPTQWSPS
jgi:hypothetical protein